MTDNFLAPPALNALAGLSSPPLVDPMDFSAQYNTPLNAAEKKAYQKWLLTLPDYQRNARDYDLQGAFKSGAATAENGHFPDTFKKPNHPTFSAESQYHGADGYVGGNWAALPNEKWQFTPGVSSARKPMWSPAELQAYFARVEPGNVLSIPSK